MVHNGFRAIDRYVGGLVVGRQIGRQIVRRAKSDYNGIPTFNPCSDTEVM
jgi:hypothetical protein